MKKILTSFLVLTLLLGGFANAQNQNSLSAKLKRTTKGSKAIVATVTSTSTWINGTQTLEFTMTYHQTGGEYMDGLRMVFPAGMVPNVTGTSDPLTAPDGCANAHLNLSINGQNVLWGRDTASRCGAYIGGTFTFQVNVTNTDLVGSQTINYTVYGDGYGNEPHIVTGSIVIPKLLAHNLGITSIVPNTAVLSGITGAPKITVHNFGTNNENSWSLTLTDGSTYTSTVTNIPINAGESLEITMDNWTPSEEEYTLTATLTLVGDEDLTNNSLTINPIVIPSYTYTEEAYALNYDLATYNIVNLTDGSMTYLADANDPLFPRAEEFDGKYIYRVCDNFSYGVVSPAGEYIQIGTMIGAEGSPIALAYDWVNERMYLMAIADNNTSELYTVNLMIGELSLIGIGTEATILAMDFANDGFLYGPAIYTNKLYRIDPATGDETAIGPLGIEIFYGQDVSFDATANKLYTYTCGDNEDDGQFGYYDITTGAFNYISDIPNRDQIATFVITKPGNIAGGIETGETLALTIYPNPNNGRFTLDFSNINGKVNYQIFDAKGSFVFGDEFTTNGNAIKELSLDLVPGIYFVKLNSNTKSLIKKLIVE